NLSDKLMGHRVPQSLKAPASQVIVEATKVAAAMWEALIIDVLNGTETFDVKFGSGVGMSALAILTSIGDLRGPLRRLLEIAACPESDIPSHILSACNLIEEFSSAQNFDKSKYPRERVMSLKSAIATMSASDRFSAEVRDGVKEWLEQNGPEDNKLMKFVTEEMGKVTEGKFQPLIDYVKTILATPGGEQKNVQAEVLEGAMDIVKIAIDSGDVMLKREVFFMTALAKAHVPLKALKSSVASATEGGKRVQIEAGFCKTLESALNCFKDFNDRAAADSDQLGEFFKLRGDGHHPCPSLVDICDARSVTDDLRKIGEESINIVSESWTKSLTEDRDALLNGTPQEYQMKKNEVMSDAELLKKMVSNDEFQNVAKLSSKAQVELNLIKNVQAGPIKLVGPELFKSAGDACAVSAGYVTTTYAVFRMSSELAPMANSKGRRVAAQRLKDELSKKKQWVNLSADVAAALDRMITGTMEDAEADSIKAIVPEEGDAEEGDADGAADAAA
ncbi:unnamed protein product, partial [Prorocentrum cordatum]